MANALLGRDVLPSGVTPLTAITTTVVHGTDEHVRAEFRDGRTERRPLADLDVLVTERGNPGNRLGLTRSPSTWPRHCWPAAWNWPTPRHRLGV